MKTYMEGLNAAQEAAVKSEENRILVLAGAGTGKTKTTISRVARLIDDGTDPKNILLLTFTRAAANEMKERIIGLIGDAGMDVLSSTFHAWAVRVIRRYSYRIGYKPTFSIYDEEDRRAIIATIIDELKYKEDPDKVLEAMNKRSVYNVPIQEVDIKSIVSEYDFRCRKNNAIDLDSLIAYLQHLLDDDTIRDEVQEQWPYIFVDEFQDTDHRQMKILDTINPQNLFIVGDDFQSIYGFRGADVSIIMKLAEDQDYQVIKLEENYRSTMPIVSAANNLIEHNNQTEKVLRTSRSGAEIVSIMADDKEEEAYIISGIIRSNGTQYKDTAILGRTNRQIQEIAEQLQEQGIPCVIKTKSADAIESQEAKKLFYWMGAILNPTDDASVESAMNWPTQAASAREKQHAELYMLEANCSLKTALEATETAVDFLRKYDAIIEAINEDYDQVDEVTAVDLLEIAIQKLAVIEHFADQGRGNKVNTINEIREQLLNWQLHQAEIGEPITAAEWLETYRMRILEENHIQEEAEDAVQIMTAHGSKGLEFEHVFIIGCNQKSFPLGKGDIEEERRLFYVAITRAKKQLFVTRSLTRNTWGGKTEPAVPSIFLKEMEG